MATWAGRIGRRSIAVGAASVLLVGAVVWVPGAGAQEASTPGTPELFNLDHVFNFNLGDHDPGDPPSPAVGSDLEFFAHTVPLRDYETGALIDEEGNPLPARSRPVMAERDFAVVGSYQRGGYVFDITNPEDTQFVTQVTCRQPATTSRSRNSRSVGAATGCFHRGHRRNSFDELPHWLGRPH